MNARYRLDGHKLQYHPRRVADFAEGKEVWPLYAEISPTSVCNHRCLFCNFNYLGHDQRRLPPGRLVSLTEELHQAGVKALVLAGAGEPTLHPDCFPALRRGRNLGLDVAMSTNGALLKPEYLGDMAASLTWVRFSIGGGTPESYARVHQTRPDDFGLVMANLAALAALKAKTRAEITIGAQCVLTRENSSDLPQLAAMVKERGADYFVVKHFYPHEENAYQPDLAFRTASYVREMSALALDMSTPDFSFIIRDVEKLDRARPYRECLGLPFIVYIREDGRLYTCFSHQDDPETAIGSLLEDDFAGLWRGPQKERTLRYINTRYDKNFCQANCRHHQINLWLRRFQSPPAHVNFI